MLFDLFSCPGLYQSLIEATGFRTGWRFREGFPFITNNIDYLHVAVWLSDHRLDPEDPWTDMIEACAINYRQRQLTNPRPFHDGVWISKPVSTVAVMLQMAPILARAQTEFHYPPVTAYTPERSFAFESEAQVDANRAATNPPLPLLTILPSSKEEELSEDAMDDDTLPVAGLPGSLSANIKGASAPSSTSQPSSSQD